MENGNKHFTFIKEVGGGGLRPLLIAGLFSIRIALNEQEIMN